MIPLLCLLFIITVFCINTYMRSKTTAFNSAPDITPVSEIKHREAKQVYTNIIGARTSIAKTHIPNETNRALKSTSRSYPTKKRKHG